MQSLLSGRCLKTCGKTPLFGQRIEFLGKMLAEKITCQKGLVSRYTGGYRVSTDLGFAYKFSLFSEFMGSLSFCPLNSTSSPEPPSCGRLCFGEMQVLQIAQKILT